MAEVTGAERFEGTRTLVVSLVLGLLGFGVLAIGWYTARVQTLFAYLTAFSFVVAVALGALIFLMIGYVVRASWSVVLRRLNEAIVGVFPLLALLFLPIGYGLAELYSWVRPDGVFSSHELELVRHKSAYLNQPFFLLRTALYFSLWIVAANWLTRASRARDAASEEPGASELDALHARERRFSAAMLPFVAVTLTFASFDWLMSLQPLWVSSLFGVYYFAGGFVASFGLLSLLAYLAQRGPVGRVLIRPPHFYALGRLMLGFTVFWAYCAFFQAMLIQIADKPEEVTFYVRRLAPGWRSVSWFLATVRFVVPFALLLPRGIKFRPGWMALLGLLLVLGEYVDVLWLVAPMQPWPQRVLNGWDLAALVALAASCVAFATWRLRGQAWVPLGDPKLGASIAYRSPL